MGGVDVECDFGGVHFQREPHAALGKHIEDRVESIGEQLKSIVDHRLGHGWERIQHVPNAGAGKAVHHADTKLLRSAGSLLQFFDGTLVDGGRVSVTPHVVGQDGFVPLVHRVADGLPHQVVNRVALHIVLVQQITLGGNVVWVAHRLVDFKVVAPAGKLEPAVPKVAAFLAQGFTRQIGPLAGK